MSLFKKLILSCRYFISLKDPVSFAEEVLPFKLEEDQKKVLMSMSECRSPGAALSFKRPRRWGKTTIMILYAIWYAHINPNSNISYVCPNESIRRHAVREYTSIFNFISKSLYISMVYCKNLKFYNSMEGLSYLSQHLVLVDEYCRIKSQINYHPSTNVISIGTPPKDNVRHKDFKRILKFV